MFRHRARTDFPTLDSATAERMLDGRSLNGAPDSHRRVADLLATLSGPATPDELEGAAAASAAFVIAHDAATQPVRRTRPVVVLAMTTAILALTTGTAFAATAGALPEPMQAVAHETLGVVGIPVPGITPQHPDPTISGGVPAPGSPTPTSSDGSGTGNPLDPLRVVSDTPSNSSNGVSTPVAGDQATIGSDGTKAAGPKGHAANSEDLATRPAGGPKADKLERKAPPEWGPGTEPAEPKAPAGVKEPKDPGGPKRPE